MNNTLTLPFSIGDTLWSPAHTPRQVTIQCPVCAGSRHITVIIGNGEIYETPCEGCGIGFNGPRGVIEEYDFTPSVTPFTIDALESMEPARGEESARWRLRANDGSSAYLHDLYPSEEAAHAVATANALAQFERNMATRQRKKASATKQSGWTIRYHLEQIKDLERQIAWHQSRASKVTR